MKNFENGCGTREDTSGTQHVQGGQIEVAMGCGTSDVIIVVII